MQSRQWRTPEILYGALAGLCLGALLLLCTTFAAVQQHRQAVKSVGQDTAPSIIAAQAIKAGLADMDANIANGLLVKPGQSAGSIAGYAQRRREVGDALIQAAENITYGDTERQPIKTMETGLSDYEIAAARARALHELGDDPAALEAYRVAYRALQETLYPAADALSRANSEALDRTYLRVNALSIGMIVLTLIAGGALIAGLIATQLFLSRRMRRTLNPPLLIATVVTIGFLAYTVRAFRVATHQLKIAKEDAFTSIQALYQARAVAYDANTDESRWLLDHARAPKYQTDFYTKSALLLQLPGGQHYETIAAATQEQIPPGAKGYLPTELGNITFAGEREAALETVRAYGVYYGDDKKIRDLENAGEHDAAVAYCISMAPGDSNWAFDQFDKALGKTLDINRQSFDLAVQQGFQSLKGMEFLCPVLAPGIAALIFAGLRPRLREYHQ